MARDTIQPRLLGRSAGTAPRPPTGTKPAASTARSDAALPGATCAHSGAPAGTSRTRRSREPAAEPAAARARARPRSRPPSGRRRRGPSDEDPVAVVGAPHVDVVAVAAGPCDARMVRRSRSGSQPRRAHPRRCRARSSSASNVTGSAADAARRPTGGTRPTSAPRSHPSGTRAVDFGGRDVGREHEVAGEPDQRVGRTGQRRQHLDPPVGAGEPAARGRRRGWRASGCVALTLSPTSSQQRVGARRTGCGRRATTRRRAARRTPAPRRAASAPFEQRSATIVRTSARSRSRRRSASPPVASRCARCAPIACPELVDAVAGRRGRADDRRPPLGRRPRARACPRGRAPCRDAPGRSALLTTNTSAISSSPAFAACTASPHPGFTTTTVVSAWPAISTSTCPTPTVSMRIHGVPTASSTRAACGVATASPPRWPRVAIERMNTPVSVAWSCMRTRSPRIAPPLNGLVGSTARTPTVAPVGADRRDEPVGERRLPGTRRAGDADRPRVAGVRVQRGDDRARVGATVLDERDQLRDRTPVTAARAFDQLGGGDGAACARKLGDAGVTRRRRLR